MGYLNKMEKEKQKKEELTEEAEDYNSQCSDIFKDLRDEGYLKRDIIGALNYCSKITDLDVGSDIYIFINGILWERKRQKKLKQEVRNSSQA